MSKGFFKTLGLEGFGVEGFGLQGSRLLGLQRVGAGQLRFTESGYSPKIPLDPSDPERFNFAYSNRSRFWLQALNLLGPIT